MLFKNFEREHTSSHSIATYLLDGMLVGALFGVVGLIIVGLHSRAVALGVAIINFFIVCYDHPWSVTEIAPRSRSHVYASHLDFISASSCRRWAYMGYKSMRAMPPGTLENLPYVEGVNYSAMQPWHVVDLHRYLFFQAAFTVL